MFINIPLSGTALLFADDGDGNRSDYYIDGYDFSRWILIQSWNCDFNGVRVHARCSKKIMFIHSSSTSTNSISKTELLVALELLGKMCQQSNALLPDTDWHRLLQHNKILTDAHNARRTYTHTEPNEANANTITCTLPYRKKNPFVLVL